MLRNLYALLMISAAFTACKQKQVADIILHNAKIYTVDSVLSIKQAIAMKEGKIIALGSDDEVLDAYASQNTIDLKQKPVYPGFIDAHSHFYGLGLSRQIIDLVATKSWDEVLERTVDFHKKNKPTFLLGRGWDQNDWERIDMPNNSKIDSIFPDLPVVLRRIDGHAAVANSKALQMAGITSKTKMAGGIVVLNNNKLTGLLIDNAAEMVMKSIPKTTDIDIEKALLDAQQVCIENGLTSLTDAGLQQNEWQILKKLIEENKIKVRVDAWLSVSKFNCNYIATTPPLQSDYLSISTLKVYADGAMGSRGACMTSPYADDIHNSGMMFLSPDSLKHMATLCLKNGYQLAVHCIGDSAVHTTLTTMGQVLQRPNDKRWRIEHAQVVQKSDYSLFKQFSIIPSVQPTHATSDMYWADERLGHERLQLAYSYQSLLKIHDWLPLGTDFPIEKVSPLLTFFAAIHRRDSNNEPALGFMIEEALSREEALKGITIWAAKAAFNEANRGSLELGKWADMVVLSDDIMTLPAPDIPKVAILKTVVAGKIVYSQ